MSVQWFPGHMAKARRQMEEQLKMVDIVIELRDARIPFSSGNPMIEELAVNKPRLIILNKADMADSKESKKWVEYLKKNGFRCLLSDSLNEKITQKMVNEVKDILKDKLEKARQRGIRKKVLRAMVVGIPNVGKSTFINNIVKKKAAKAENHPGVTKALQWIRINEDLELLDTPGVLWPKFSDDKTGLMLALMGSISDEVLDRKDLVTFGLKTLKENHPDMLSLRYGISGKEEDLFEAIARKKCWLNSDGNINEDTACSLILKDIRSGALGRITYEYVTE